MPGQLDSIVLASSNAGKLREIERLLGDTTKVVAQTSLGIADADETGKTFVENALIKAQHAVQASGLPALADDSGLVVDALDGAPGVYSARYAGAGASDQDNVDKLLTALSGVAETDRGAAFHCAAVLLIPGVETALIATGEWHGRILRAPRGSAGFGYDPVFFDAELAKSAAELSPEQKNSRSHRGQALRQLISLLQKHRF